MTPLAEAVHAAPHWQRIAIASDLHLSASAPATAALWHQALARCDADAVVLLGDYFDFWVGDDVLQAPITPDADGQAIAFWQDCAQALHRAALQRPVYWMAGNRDFLAADTFMAACGLQPLADPCVLHWGAQRWLLSHGDAWCTDDADYMAFRARVRGTAWQQEFLDQPLRQRLTLARAMREASQARHHDMAAISDVDSPTVAQHCAELCCTGVIHGHTHQGISVDLPTGAPRHVTLDWDASAPGARAQWLMLSPQGISRVALAAD